MFKVKFKPKMKMCNTNFSNQTQMDLYEENCMKRDTSENNLLLAAPCFSTAVNSLQRLWENDDSCCLFSNSYRNCTMALFPMGRPELIPV